MLAVENKLPAKAGKQSKAITSLVTWPFVNLGNGYYLSTIHVIEVNEAKWPKAMRIVKLISTQLEPVVIFFIPPDARGGLLTNVCNVRVLDIEQLDKCHMKRMGGDKKWVDIPLTAVEGPKGGVATMHYEATTIPGDSGKHLRQGNYTVGLHVGLDEAGKKGVGTVFTAHVKKIIDDVYKMTPPRDDSTERALFRTAYAAATKQSV
eukprot:GHVR01037760.1.p1 GENE.GHVR01037760.1~~GHVR01037760.1.p1  ORF type:complete len:206 (-),score=30.88 GHVR01037760.1:1635-2252(-)